MYADFVASFEEPIPYKLGTTSFVKSGTLQPRGNGFFCSIDYTTPFNKKIIDPISDGYDSPVVPKSSFKPMPFVRAGESLTQSKGK